MFSRKSTRKSAYEPSKFASQDFDLKDQGILLPVQISAHQDCWRHIWFGNVGHNMKTVCCLYPAGLSNTTTRWPNFSFKLKSRWRFESATWKASRPWKAWTQTPPPLAHRTCLSKSLCREYLSRTVVLCLRPWLLRPRTTWISSWKACTKRQAPQRCGWHHWNPQTWRNPMTSKKRFLLAAAIVSPTPRIAHRNRTSGSKWLQPLAEVCRRCAAHPWVNGGRLLAVSRMPAHAGRAWQNSTVPRLCYLHANKLANQIDVTATICSQCCSAAFRVSWPNRWLRFDEKYQKAKEAARQPWLVKNCHALLRRAACKSLIYGLCWRPCVRNNKPTHNRSYPCAGKLSTGRCVSLLAKEHTYKLLLPAGRNCPGKRKDPPGEIPPAKSEPGAKSKPKAKAQTGKKPKQWFFFGQACCRQRAASSFTVFLLWGWHAKTSIYYSNCSNLIAKTGSCMP